MRSEFFKRWRNIRKRRTASCNRSVPKSGVALRNRGFDLAALALQLQLHGFGLARGFDLALASRLQACSFGFAASTSQFRRFGFGFARLRPRGFGFAASPSRLRPSASSSRLRPRGFGLATSAPRLPRSASAALRLQLRGFRFAASSSRLSLRSCVASRSELRLRSFSFAASASRHGFGFTALALRIRSWL